MKTFAERQQREIFRLSNYNLASIFEKLDEKRAKVVKTTAMHQFALGAIVKMSAWERTFDVQNTFNQRMISEWT